MMETLDRLMNLHGKNAKGIVWEHNTHIGDARATDMKRAGMVNIGQLAREQYGINKVYLAGFASYQGSVIAGKEWDAPMQVMEVPPARDGSIEHTLHQEGHHNRFYLFSEELKEQHFFKTIPHRAIGVVYHPDREHYGNYVPSLLSKRYDAFIFIDKTKALHPLKIDTSGEKVPDTYPFGF